MTTKLFAFRSYSALDLQPQTIVGSLTSFKHNNDGRYMVLPVVQNVWSTPCICSVHIYTKNLVSSGYKTRLAMFSLVNSCGTINTIW